MLELSARGVTTDQVMRLKNMYEAGQIDTGTTTTTMGDMNTSRLRDGLTGTNMMGYGMYGGMMYPGNDSLMYSSNMLYPMGMYGLQNSMVKPEDMVFGRNIFTNRILHRTTDWDRVTK